MGRLIVYILATSYSRRGRRDVKLRGQDVFRRLFAEWNGMRRNAENLGRRILDLR